MFRKKNLVILAMLVVVCGAVILNYQFQNEDAKLAATSTVENGESEKDKILGEALLVNGNQSGEQKDGQTEQTATTGENQNGEKKEGDAQTATNQDGEQKDGTDTQEGTTTTAAPVKGDYFAEARVDRKQTRDEAIELLKSIVADKNNSEDVKKKANDDLAAIAAAMEKEASIETLIKAKGFEDCLVVLSDNTANVMVKTAGLDTPQVAQIKEIVIAETALPGSSIKIIEIK